MSKKEPRPIWPFVLAGVVVLAIVSYQLRPRPDLTATEKPTAVEAFVDDFKRDRKTAEAKHADVYLRGSISFVGSDFIRFEVGGWNVLAYGLDPKPHFVGQVVDLRCRLEASELNSVKLKLCRAD